jgi:UPF0755 protein
MKQSLKKKYRKTSSTSWFIIPFVLTIFLALGLVTSHFIFLKPIFENIPKYSEFEKVRIKIQAPTSVLNVTQQFLSQGIEAPRPLVAATILASKFKGSIKPGLYEFDKKTSLFSVIGKMVKGDTLKSKILLIEGWPIWKIREVINAHPDLKHTSITFDNTKLATELGLNKNTSIEGIFFPSTYFFEPGTEDLQIYKIAYRTMQKKLIDAWSDRSLDISIKDKDELLILASLIEKETGIASDRSMISGVFHNRLKMKMRLQTDPSVIYGLGEKFNGNLTKKDLKSDGPYNTYTRMGLPPSPIAAPSNDSIIAAVKPKKTEALYFVANGKGGSVFSSTLEDHEQAVDKYQRKRSKN